jgi:glycosyltransferase involved in cell wall biosynthesis
VDQDNSQKTTALFIGKELFRKGGDLLLNAFARTRNSVPDARLLFLTADPIPSELPLNGVEVIKPTWKRESIAALYRRSHFLVLPSRLETWGDVLLEAMGYGLPCIGVCGQAMEEVIDDQENGLIVHPENVQALAEAMTSLFQNTQLRKCLGQAAREKAEAEFTWERVVDRLIPVINDAVKMYYRLPHGE